MADRHQMRQECIKRIEVALKRKLKPSQAEDMLKGMYRALDSARIRADKKWAEMSEQQRLDAATKIFQQRLKEHANKVRERARLTVIAQDRINRQHQANRARGRYGLSSVQAILEGVSRRVNAMQNYYKTRLAEDIADELPGKWFGLLADKEFERAVVEETYGHDTKSNIAKKVAAKFKEVSDATLKRYNAAGGELNSPEHYLPQTHDISRLTHATEVLARQGRLKQLSNTIRNTLGKKVNMYEANKNAWAEYVDALLDYRQYENMTREERLDMLRGAYDTLITDGDEGYDVSKVAGQKIQPRGGRVDKGDQARVLHFRGPDEFFAYRERFGKGSLLDSMMGAVSQRAKDIALLEELGPSPNHMVDGMKRIAEAEAKQGTMIQGVLRNPLDVNMVDASWAVLNGEATRVAPGRELIASVFEGARNLEIVGKLQSTFINSLSDLSSYFVAANLSHVPFFRAASTLFTSLGSENRELMARGGLLADTLSSSMSKWAESNIGQGWTSMLANATMKVSLLDAWTQAVRRAAMQNHMGMLANMVRKEDGLRRPWDEVDPYTRRLLERSGVDELTWRIWAEAHPFERNGAKYLTTQDIAAIDISKPELIGDEKLKGMIEKKEISQMDVDRAGTALVAFLNDESGLASIGPDLFTRAATSWGQAKGTVRGEMVRSLLLFKGYPIAFMRRHLERMADLAETRGKADAVKYAALLFTTTTALAGISVQLKELLAGRDVQNMTNSDFWLQAISVGGGAGLLTDMIVSGVDGHNAYGSPNLLRFLGPVLNTALDTFDVGAAYFSEGLYDKEMRANAKALKLLRGHAPFVNLWYTKSIFDRAIYNDLMEMSSPGYLARVEKFQRKEKNIGYWLPQRSLTPRRAPRFDTSPPVRH